jgi:glucosamine kinase
MSDPLYIGVDGGGTNCRARIRDSAGALLGEGSGGPANVRLDPKLVMDSILTASRGAAAAAGLPERDLHRAHAGFGLAGAALTSAHARLLGEPHPFLSVAIQTDAYVSWLGAHGGADGAILIVGTGSCGLAVVGGRQVYVGGYGAEVSDEASGAWIGREAIRRSLWAFDGRTAMTPLAEAVLTHFKASAEAVIAFATQARPADYGAFVPLVVEHGERGDPLAAAILGQAIADMVAMIERMLAAGAPAVALIGGLAAVLERRLPDAARAHLCAPQGDALDGAILMARRAAETGGRQPAGARA